MWTYLAEIQDLDAGLSDVGYRVVDDAGDVLTAFTIAGVSETIAGVSGNYAAEISLPDTPARVQWFSDNGNEFEGEERVTPPAAPLDINAALTAYDVAKASDVSVTVDGGFTDDDRDALNATHETITGFGAGQIVVTSPVINVEGDTQVTRGGDYFKSENRALKYDCTGGGIDQWNIDRIDFIVNNRDTLVVTATHDDIEGGIRVWVELTKEQTRALRWKTVTYNIEAILTNDHELPVGSGTLYVKDGGE